MSEAQIEAMLEGLRYLANAEGVDRVVANHARGILVRVATAEEGTDTIKG